MAQETFRFSYTVFAVQATLDDGQLVVRTGMRTVVAPVDRLQHLHVNAPRGADHVELLLSHLLPSGALKRSRIHADAGQAGFDALIAALLSRRPEIDIRDLSPDEAYRRTGAKPMIGVAIPAIMAGGWLIVALALSPLLIHGLDRGQTRTTVAGLAGPLESRNVTVLGRVSLAHAYHAPSETDQRLGATSAWLPLVGPDWTPTAPVTAVLEIRGIRPEALLEVAEQGEFAGIVRDVGWESLGSQARAGLTAAGVAVPRDAKVVQYRGDSRDDLVVFGAILAFLGLLVAGVWLKLRAT